MSSTNSTSISNQHTPGPWIIQGEGILLHPVTKAQLLTTRIETSLGTFEILDETNEPDGNARLIAAAPELLSALQEVDKSCPWGHADELADAAFGRLKRVARAAIAKATNQPNSNE